MGVFLKLLEHLKGSLFLCDAKVPLTNRLWPGLTEFGLPEWQAEANSISSLSASPATAMGQIVLAYGTESFQKFLAANRQKKSCHYFAICSDKKSPLVDPTFSCNN